MSAYGKVIDGGAQMRKGVTKNINDKLAKFAAGHAHGQKIATAVRDVYKVNTLSEQHTQNINGGKFQKGTRPAKV